MGGKMERHSTSGQLFSMGYVPTSFLQWNHLLGSWGDFGAQVTERGCCQKYLDAVLISVPRTLGFYPEVANSHGRFLNK